MFPHTPTDGVVRIFLPNSCAATGNRTHICSVAYHLRNLNQDALLTELPQLRPGAQYWLKRFVSCSAQPRLKWPRPTPATARSRTTPAAGSTRRTATPSTTSTGSGWRPPSQSSGCLTTRLAPRKATTWLYHGTASRCRILNVYKSIFLTIR